MSLAEKLDALPSTPSTPAMKLREALSLYEDGVAMQRLKLRRRFPALSEQELDRELDRWLARQDEAR
jgi:hypothetical protein